MNKAQTTMLLWEDPEPLDESTLLITQAEKEEFRTWLEDNQGAMINVCRHFAIVAVGYTKEDERWNMSALICTMLALAFPDRIRVVETRGYDILFRLDNGRELRISVKVGASIFQDYDQRSRWRLLEPQNITLVNARSAKSAEQKRDDFDILLAIQRGPFKGGPRNGRYIVRFAMVPNCAWLQDRITANSDSQQQVRITNAEWYYYGFLGPESEIRRTAAVADVREIENDMRREKAKRLLVVANRITEAEDEDQVC